MKRYHIIIGDDVSRSDLLELDRQLVNFGVIYENDYLSRDKFDFYLESDESENILKNLRLPESCSVEDWSDRPVL